MRSAAGGVSLATEPYPFTKYYRSSILLPFRRMGRCTYDFRFVCGKRWAFILCNLTCFIANPNALQPATFSIVSTGFCHRRLCPRVSPSHSFLIPLGQPKCSLSPSPPRLAAPSLIQRHSSAGNNDRRSLVSRVFGGVDKGAISSAISGLCSLCPFAAFVSRFPSPAPLQLTLTLARGWVT